MPGYCFTKLTSASKVHPAKTLTENCIVWCGLAGILQIIARRTEYKLETEALKNGSLADTKPWKIDIRYFEE